MGDKNNVPASDWRRELPARVTLPETVLLPEMFSIAPLPEEAPEVERVKLFARLRPPWTSKLPVPLTATAAVPRTLLLPETFTIPCVRARLPVNPALEPVKASSPVPDWVIVPAP